MPQVAAPAIRSVRKPLGHAIRTLHITREEQLWIPTPRVFVERLQTHLRLHEMPFSRSVQTSRQSRDLPCDLRAVGNGKLRRLRRRCRPSVGGKVRQRRVRLMTDGRDHRNAGGIDRTHHGLFVERPQILGGAAAAPDDEHVHGIFLIEESDRRGNLSRRFRSLYEYGMENEPNAVPPAL